MATSVSILGAGHCGCAMAADLLNRNIPVLLYAHPEHRRNVDAIQQRGHLLSDVAISGAFSPLLSTSMAEAVQFSKYLIVTVPAYGHETIIAELAKFDLRDHVVICITGNFFTLIARKRLNARVLLETATSPYASRFIDGQIKIVGIKQWLPIASWPAHQMPGFRDQIQALFPAPLNWRTNVLEIGLMCITGVIHPTPMVMNTGWVETTHGDFYFYRDGMSPSVSKVIEDLDAERIHIARQFGLQTESILEIMNICYGHDYDTFLEFARESPEHNLMRVTPSTLHHRFVDQDIPYVLVPWFQLGQKVGLPCPTLGSIIHLASIANKTDYQAVGRNLDTLGIRASSKDDILALVEEPDLQVAS